MLNLFQHLIETIDYEATNQVRGDKIWIIEQLFELCGAKKVLKDKL